MHGPRATAAARRGAVGILDVETASLRIELGSVRQTEIRRTNAVVDILDLNASDTRQENTADPTNTGRRRTVRGLNDGAADVHLVHDLTIVILNLVVCLSDQT